MTRKRRLRALKSLEEKANNAATVAAAQGSEESAEQYRRLADLCRRVAVEKRGIPVTPKPLQMSDRELLIRLDQRMTDVCEKLDREFKRQDEAVRELKASFQKHKDDDKWLYRAAASGFFGAIGALCLAIWHFLTSK